MRVSNQMHGKTFENIVKSSNHFSHSAADTQRAPTELFDINSNDDVRDNMPSAIKVTGSKSVALSDARNFWQMFNHVPFRIIIGIYTQKGNVKEFAKIYEFEMNNASRSVFFGSVRLREITALHNGIGLKNFPRGKHVQARLWAKKTLVQIKPRLGILRLNRKIDSESQRRLQCSVSLSEMLTRFQPAEHTNNFGDIVLPFALISGRRKFSQ